MFRERGSAASRRSKIPPEVIGSVSHEETRYVPDVMSSEVPAVRCVEDALRFAGTESKEQRSGFYESSKYGLLDVISRRKEKIRGEFNAKAQRRKGAKAQRRKERILMEFAKNVASRW